jgi:excisionase family DNA binding protein
MPLADEILSAQELANYLQVPMATVYKWRSLGLGPQGLKAGRHLRFRKAEVDRWLLARQEESREAAGHA